MSRPDGTASWAEAYALLAQTLLEAPRRNTSSLYDSELWRSFPRLNASGEVSAAATAVAKLCPNDDDAMSELGVDYAHLFIGPPKPSSMPWQTMYVNPNATALSGTPTVQVRLVISSLGLQRSNDNGQLEDHIGNILMVAAVMAQRELHQERHEFVDVHVLSWIDDLIVSVKANASTDFYVAILRLVKAVAEADVKTARFDGLSIQ